MREVGSVEAAPARYVGQHRVDVALVAILRCYGNGWLEVQCLMPPPVKTNKK